jgi:hypothetical protein
VKAGSGRATPLAAVDPGAGFCVRDLVHANLARRGEVADPAALNGGQGGVLAQRYRGVPVGECEQASSEVGAGIAGQFERERSGQAGEPEGPPDAAFPAIVDLTPYHAVMNAPRHAGHFSLSIAARQVAIR